MNIPENLKYTQDHEWILVEGDQVTVGITDFAKTAVTVITGSMIILTIRKHTILCIFTHIIVMTAFSAKYKMTAKFRTPGAVLLLFIVAEGKRSVLP